MVNPNSTKATQVSFKISNVAPKKATYNITSWKVIAVDENGNDITDKITEDGYKKDASGITIDAKDKNGNFRKDAKITIPKGTKAKTVIKVAAYTDGGVMVDILKDTCVAFVLLGFTTTTGFLNPIAVAF